MQKNAHLKVYVETHGCAANKADAETMITLLIKAGHKIVDKPAKADVVLLNTCAVKGPTERRMLSLIKKYAVKPLVIAGCLPLIKKDVLKLPYSVISPWSIGDVTEVVEATALGKRMIKLFGKRPFLLDHFRFNRLIEIIPIAEGCLGACTYCAVRFARGHLKSYPIELIVERAKKALRKGVKEIWITSQDCGAFGIDINETISDLLEELIKIKGDFKIRVGMANPNFILKQLNRLIKIYRSKKIFRFLHIPIQSGSNKVLRDMNRFYRVEDVVKIIKEFRKLRTTIATDIIVGYPTESEEDFKQTLSLLKKIRPDVTNISKFEARPGTRAAKLKPLNSKIVKERSRILSSLARKIALERNLEWIGWKGNVIIDEIGKGRNYTYKQVVVKAKFGSIAKVKIINATHTSLIGKVIK